MYTVKPPWSLGNEWAYKDIRLYFKTQARCLQHKE